MDLRGTSGTVEIVENEMTKEEESKLDEEYGDSSKYCEANLHEPPPSYDTDSSTYINPSLHS